MFIPYDKFKNEIIEILIDTFEEEGKKNNQKVTITSSELQALISTPPEFEMGQGALPCFPFAKILKISPQNIAKIFEEAINKNSKKKYIKAATAVNAYVNFYCNFENILVEKSNCFDDYQEPFFPLANKEKVVVEYSQPNTHKAMHVGHLRCLVLGDAVSNLLGFVGHQVIRATYPGDMGTHVAKVLWYLTHPTPKPFPTDSEDKATWLGKMYAQADEAFKQTLGSAQESQTKKEIGEVLADLHKSSGKYFDIWKETRQWSLDYLQNIYTWLNTKFDIWYFESECESPAKKLVLQKYEEGFFVKDNGAIGIDLTPWKLGFAMYLKSDGNSLYLTKDLDLISKKFADPGVTKSVYVVDARQKFHFDQLFKTAELMGYSQAKRSQHLSYETVNSENGTPFSSRELNGLALLDLKETMERKVITDYLEKYRDTWSEEDIHNTARDVTIGALKYGMLRVDNNTQIHFSLSEWLRLDGDTGPYLQYVHARCCSILEKFHIAEGFSPTLIEKNEQELLFMINRFYEFVLQGAEQCRPSLLATYLFQLCKQFNRFYESCPIKDASFDVKNSRLNLVTLTKKTIAEGLALLGIPAPNRM